MPTLLAIALQNLLQHRRRALMLGGALAGISLLLTLLNGLALGVREQFRGNVAMLSAGEINVGGIFKVNAVKATPVLTSTEKALEVIRREVPDVAFVGVRGQGLASVSSDTAALRMDLIALGVDWDAEPLLRAGLKAKEGDVSLLREPHTLVLFPEQAEQLGNVKPGERLTLSAVTPQGAHNTVDVKLVAIAENAGIGSRVTLLMPNATLRELFRYHPGAASVLQVHLKDELPEERLRDAREKLRQALTKAGLTLGDYDPGDWQSRLDEATSEAWTGQRVVVSLLSEEVAGQLAMLGALDALITLLGLVLLVVVCTGLMNALWIAISERTREIGTLRAVGMQRRSVLGLFLLEGALLGFLGTAAGLVLGAVACAALDAANLATPTTLQYVLGAGDHLRFAVAPSQLVSVCLLLTACAALASLPPALRAARLSPLAAMQSAG